MQFGYFDDAAREYVITTPDTPLPWINYLGSQEFFSLFSHRGGGYSFYRDAKMRRLTRFRYNNIPSDEPGRYLYINDDGDVWTPTYAPVKAPLDSFECRHGLGYSTITSERRGLRVSTLFFVPVGVNAEVQHVTLTNTSDTPKHLHLFSYVEFCLWNAEDDQTNYQRNLSLGQVEIEGSTIYHVTEYRERRNHYAVFSVNTDIAGFDTDRDTFLGGVWNSLAQAQVPRQGHSQNSVASGWYPIGSHQIDVSLAPGESRELVFVLGYVENPDDDKWEDEARTRVRKAPARELLARFATTAQVRAEFADLRAYWDDLLGSYTLDSGDVALNRMVNVWNQYQCMVTFNLSRSASYFETGIGRGMGFRDSNQDLLGFVHMVPGRARERILDIAATQWADGSAYHQYQPLTKRGNDAIGSGFNDDPLWLIFGVAAYLKETGDWGILEEPVPFDNDPATAAPLLEHLGRSFQHVLNNLGPHGLPLIGRADWNDCLNLNCFSTTPGESFQTTENRSGGVAESVFIAGMVTLIGPDYAKILDHEGLAAQAAVVREAVGAMHRAIATYGWDGRWFLRAYDYYGNKVGSAESDEGNIYIEPQGMCIMGGSGLADGRAALALDSVQELLASEHGIAILAPPYTYYHVELGEISTYPPGYKENGGIFCHNNPWVIIAETIAGSPQRAFDYYRRITPAYREPISEVHRLEPYVYPQMIAGPQAPRFGEAKNSWLTGTAAWAYHAVTQWMLGIRPTFDGLLVAPRMPADFGDYTVTRRYRGATYHIHVTASPTGTLTINGHPAATPLIPPAPVGSTVNVTWS